MPEHTHHWLIDEPDGEFSTGRCDCGVEKEFANSETNCNLYRPTKGGWNNTGMFNRPFTKDPPKIIAKVN